MAHPSLGYGVFLDTMSTGHSVDDEDDDSTYSGDGLPHPGSSTASETVLNPSSPQTLQLDEKLDDDDAQYLRDNPQAMQVESDSDNMPSSGSEDVNGNPRRRATRIDVLDSPPRYPEEPNWDDDGPTRKEEHDTEKSLSERFEKQVRLRPGSKDDSGSGEQVVTIDAEDDDDWFDSDENKVEVESLESSEGSTGNLEHESTEKVNDESVHVLSTMKPNGTELPVRNLDDSRSGKPKQAGGGAYSLLSRASQTFYKAFKKTSKKATGTASSSGNDFGRKPGTAVGQAEQVAGSEREDNLRHERMMQLLDAQIATLNGARTGFVDLNLLKPMTEKTVEAIEGEGKELLGDYAEIERRSRELAKESVEAEREGEWELEAKEKLLINAKMRLAEAHGEVDGLRHELRRLQRLLEAPERVEARLRAERRKRRESVEGEVFATREARIAAERRLEGQRGELKQEEEELDRLDKKYRDIEGDWA